jgi:hypothetical protein
MTSGIRRRVMLTVGAFGAVAAAAIALAPLVGSTPVDLRRALDRSIPFDQKVDA